MALLSLIQAHHFLPVRGPGCCVTHCRGLTSGMLKQVCCRGQDHRGLWWTGLLDLTRGPCSSSATLLTPNGAACVHTAEIILASLYITHAEVQMGRGQLRYCSMQPCRVEPAFKIVGRLCRRVPCWVGSEWVTGALELGCCHHICSRSCMNITKQSAQAECGRLQAQALLMLLAFRLTQFAWSLEMQHWPVCRGLPSLQRSALASSTLIIVRGGFKVTVCPMGLTEHQACYIEEGLATCRRPYLQWNVWQVSGSSM